MAGIFGFVVDMWWECKRNAGESVSCSGDDVPLLAQLILQITNRRSRAFSTPQEYLWMGKGLKDSLFQVYFCHGLRCPS